MQFCTGKLLRQIQMTWAKKAVFCSSFTWFVTGSILCTPVQMPLLLKKEAYFCSGKSKEGESNLSSLQWCHHILLSVMWRRFLRAFANKEVLLFKFLHYFTTKQREVVPFLLSNWSLSLHPPSPLQVSKNITMILQAVVLTCIVLYDCSFSVHCYLLIAAHDLIHLACRFLDWSPRRNIEQILFGKSKGHL